MGLYRDNGEENGNYYILYWVYMGRMEKKMETTTLWGYVGSKSISGASWGTPCIAGL